jgi:predicted ester cyclase
MTEAERVWTIYINAWNKHDIDSVLATVAEQFVYDERPMTMSDVIRGRQAFREYLRGIFNLFPDLRIQVFVRVGFLSRDG